MSVLCDGLADFSFDAADIEIKFTRRNYENILSKSQTLVTMLGNDKIHPKSAYEASGLFIDTEDAYRLGMEWLKDREAKAEAEMKAQRVKADEQPDAVG